MIAPPASVTIMCSSSFVAPAAVACTDVPGAPVKYVEIPMLFTVQVLNVPPASSKETVIELPNAPAYFAAKGPIAFALF